VSIVDGNLVMLDTWGDWAWR